MIDERKRKREMNNLIQECIRRKKDDKEAVEYIIFRADQKEHMTVRTKAQAISIAKRIGGTYAKI